MIPSKLQEYRSIKGIRRPKRFCEKPRTWFGNLYDTYGEIKREGLTPLERETLKVEFE